MDTFKKVNDDDNAGDITIFKKDLEFLHNGLKLLLDNLTRYDETIKEFNLTQSPFEQEKARITQMIRSGEKILSDDSDFPMTFLRGISYRTLRYLKAGGLMQVRQLEKKKQDLLLNNPNLPMKVLQSIDEKISQLINFTELGVFNGLEPVETLLDINNLSETSGRQKVEHIVQKKSPIIIETEGLHIIDEELRQRCLNLLDKLHTDERTENYLDTVVREMSVILEDRIKKTAGITEKITGKPLMTKVFANKPPILVFSDDEEVQQSAYFLYAGFSGFVRNEVMHKVVHTFTKERVLQLLGYVDYLLFLLTQAKKIQQ